MSDPAISIIDDDELMRRAIAGLVRSLGFHAETFASAEDFLAAKARHSARCIITDIHMPGMSGIELKKRLTAEGCATPVIMITARSESVLHTQAQACGAFCFLKKPFEASALVSCLERALAS